MIKKSFIFFLAFMLMLSCSTQSICEANTYGSVLDPKDKGLAKWGYIDANGQIMLYPSFDHARPFCSDRARVFLGKVDSMGYPDEGHFGYIDREGKIVIPVSFDQAGDFSKFGFAVVKKDGKCWIINTDGKTVLKDTYTYIAYSEANNLYLAYNEDMSKTERSERMKYFIIDSKGNITALICESATMEEGCITDCAYSHDYACALFDLSGRQITGYIYEDLKNFSEGVGRYKREGKYGLITTKGEELTSPIYDNVGFVHNGKVVVQYDGKYCLIDIKGEFLTEYGVDEIRLYDSLKYNVMCAFVGNKNNMFDQNNRYYLMNPEGDYLSRAYKHTVVMPKDGVYYVLEDGVHYILNQIGNETPLPIDCKDIKVYNQDRFLVYRDRMYALVDLQGNMLTDYVWSDVILSDEDDEWICVCY